jgi:serine/threonine protein kinase
MTLVIGARLGSYEILATLGAGGMGKVYRARDTKLNRDIALKILPESFITDRDRLAGVRRSRAGEGPRGRQAKGFFGRSGVCCSRC